MKIKKFLVKLTCNLDEMVENCGMTSLALYYSLKSSELIKPMIISKDYIKTIDEFFMNIKYYVSKYLIKLEFH